VEFDCRRANFPGRVRHAAQALAQLRDHQARVAADEQGTVADAARPVSVQGDRAELQVCWGSAPIRPLLFFRYDGRPSAVHFTGRLETPR
jgi:serine protease inhibitor